MVCMSCTMLCAPCIQVLCIPVRHRECCGHSRTCRGAHVQFSVAGKIELLGHQTCVFLSLLDNSKQLSKVVLIYTLIGYIKIPVNSCLANTCQCINLVGVS